MALAAIGAFVIVFCLCFGTIMGGYLVFRGGGEQTEESAALPTRTRQQDAPPLAGPTSAPPKQATATRPATPTRRPQPTQPPAQPDVNGIVDDFSDPDSGWGQVNTEVVEMAYIDRPGYQVLIRETDTWAWNTRPEIFDDVVVSIRGYLVRQGGAYLGVICRYQDENNFYAASVMQDAYNIGMMSNGTWIDLTPQTWMPLRNPIPDTQEGFDLSFSCIGDSLSLLVNGDRLPAVTDSQLTRGETGLLAGSNQQRAQQKNGYYTQALFEDYRALIP